MERQLYPKALFQLFQKKKKKRAMFRNVQQDNQISLSIAISLHN